MKKLLSFLCVALFLTENSYSQEQINTSTEEIPTDSILNTVNGFQFGVRKGITSESTEEASVANQPDLLIVDAGTEYQMELGLTFGWAKNFEREIGIRSSLNYDSYDCNTCQTNFGALNLEANATYMMNQHVIPYAGLNLNKYLDGYMSDLSPGFGYQIGFTGHMINQISYQFAYQVINNNGLAKNVDGEGTNIDIDTQIKSLQLGIIYTL